MIKIFESRVSLTEIKIILVETTLLRWPYLPHRGILLCTKKNSLLKKETLYSKQFYFILFTGVKIIILIILLILFMHLFIYSD